MRQPTGNIRSAHRTRTSPWRYTQKANQDLQKVLDLARKSHADLQQISVVYRMQFGELPDGRNPVRLQGWAAQSSRRRKRSSGSRHRSIDQGRRVRHGLSDERGETADVPIPWSCAATALSSRSANSHGCCRVSSIPAGPGLVAEEEELIAAKMVGRWRSGAPLVLAPDRDDPALGADGNRNNDFGYADDMKGLKCPFSAHIRRVNPRDALKDDVVAVNLTISCAAAQTTDHPCRRACSRMTAPSAAASSC
jgi:hypothetical protein